MIGKILTSPRRIELREIVLQRIGMDNLGMDRLRSWIAVQTLVDFDTAMVTLGDAIIDSDLVWDFRGQLGVRVSDGTKRRLELGPRQLEWDMRNLRVAWPAIQHPGSLSGDRNAWDATDFLNWTIARLGDDVRADAIAAMADLAIAEDGYTDKVQIIAAE